MDKLIKGRQQGRHFRPGRGFLPCALIFLTLPVLFSSCGLMPEEEELPAAPVIRSYEAEEYEQTIVMRGDMMLTKRVKCTYASARQEKYSFSLGGLYIDKIYVTEGEQVEKGALLAELEPGDLPERISAGEYEIKALRIKKENLLANQKLELDKQEIILAGMEDQIDELMLKAQSGETDEEKKALVDQANETLIQFLEKEKQKEELGETHRKEQQELDDSLYIADIRLKELKEELRERQIYAGISGTVTYLRDTAEGERSVKGRTFVTVADLDTVVFTVKGADAQYFPAGAQATVTVGKKEYPVQAVDGAEFGIEEAGEEDESMAYLQLLAPDPTLEDGASGSIHITLDERRDVLYVDKDAIKSAGGNTFVYMLDENGLRTRRDVVTGLKADDHVEIISGLTEGESVILE